MKTAADPNSRAEQGKIPWGRLGFLWLTATILTVAACSSKPNQPAAPADAFADALTDAQTAAPGPQDADAAATPDAEADTAIDGQSATDSASETDAASDIDTDTAPDTPQAQCSAAGSDGQPCAVNSFSCGAGICAAGGCKPAPAGQFCGSAVKPCDAQVCDGKGLCLTVQLPVDSTCTSTAPGACHKNVGKCSVSGVCALEVVVGSACPLTDAGPCLKPGVGVCLASGSCEPVVDVGAACGLDKGACGKGVCSASGACQLPALGTPCVEGIGSCQVGQCDGQGGCVAQKAPAGAACKPLVSDACHAASGTCSASGTCVAAVLVGEACAAAPGICGGGSCDAAGVCVLSAMGKVCGSQTCQVGICNAAAECGFTPIAAGSPCEVANPPECYSAKGSCSASGSCQLSVTAGVACELAWGPCGAGICQADGSCKATAVGQACMAPAGPCQEAVCASNGFCKAVAMPAGSSCPFADPGPCQASTGSCSAAGQCQPLPKPAGSSCSVAKPGPCQKNTGTCSAAGQCLADADTGAACSLGGQGCSSGTCGSDGTCMVSAMSSAGAPCGPDVGCGVPTCDGKGACVASPALSGKACGGTSPFACSKRVCTAAGQCVLGPNPGAECFAQGEPAQLACSPANQCTGGVCGSEIGQCQLKLLPGKACKATSECSTGVCGAAGVCTQVPIAEGKPCALGPGQDPACTTGVCVAGTCAMVAKTGAACGSHPCKVGSCSAQGICEFTPLPGKICGPGSFCTNQVCDAAGVCQVVAKLSADCPSASCYAQECSAEGICTQKLKVGAACSGPGLCGAGVCTAQGQCVDPLYPKPPACSLPLPTGPSECWTSAVDAQGKCTKVAKVGAACGCSISPCSQGTCQADGSCQLKPSKPPGAPCSSSCVKDGVCTSSGHCSGATEVGKSCEVSNLSPLAASCTQGKCQESGDCTAEFAPAGISCAAAAVSAFGPGQMTCGKVATCDGKGTCVVANPAPAGTPCGGAGPCSPPGTCKDGYCLSQTPTLDGKPCTEGCAAGHCAGGVCTPKQSSGQLCDDGNACTEDVCCSANSCGSPVCCGVAAGTCTHIIDAGKICFDDGCTTGMCDTTTGQCAVKSFVTGKPCGTNSCGDKLVCIMFDCLPASGAISCQDDNPCTVDYCGSCGCTHAPDAYLEGQPCAQGGHCLKGNCVPD